MATASSSASQPATDARLGPLLAGAGELDLFSPPIESAEQAIREVAAYCRDYCPVVNACVEDHCRLYRVEGRALEALGFPRGPSERVGVVAGPVSAL